MISIELMYISLILGWFVWTTWFVQCINSYGGRNNVSKLFKISVVEYYDYVWSLRDRRVDDWPLMQSIVPTLLLSASYFIICIFLGPWLMKEKKPYEFKNLIQVYNLSQVLISAYICYEICATGWFSHYNWVRKYSNNRYRQWSFMK